MGAHSAAAVSTVAPAAFMAAVAEASMEEGAVAGGSTAVAGEDFMAAAGTADRSRPITPLRIER